MKAKNGGRGSGRGVGEGYFLLFCSHSSLRADVSKYRPEVYKTEKSKILKKLHKVALGKLLT